MFFKTVGGLNPSSQPPQCQAFRRVQERAGDLARPGIERSHPESAAKVQNGRSNCEDQKAPRNDSKTLAEKTGLTTNYISLIENGDRSLSLEALNQVADALEVPAVMITFAASQFSPRGKEDKALADLRESTLSALWQVLESSIRRQPATIGYHDVIRLDPGLLVEVFYCRSFHPSASSGAASARSPLPASPLVNWRRVSS